MASVLELSAQVRPDARAVALVADGDSGSRLVLRLLLEREGFLVVVAANGEAALEQYDARRPSLVLLDAVLSGLDGFAVARAIKARAGQRFVSVIFLTALTDPDELGRCLDAGGDDVMTKPYKPALLQARVRSAARACKAHAVLMRQFEELNTFRRNVEEDVRVAQRILGRIVRPEELAADNVRHLLRPYDVVSGDFVLACRRPNGGQLLLLGDASGHGLPAAVTAMLVADTFYAMGSKGLAIPEIVLEMNRKLRGMLPVGRYLAAAIVEFDADDRRLAIWNAGLPDVLVAAASGSMRRYPSCHVPLGVLDSAQVEVDVDLVAVTPESFVYVYTDGISETRNSTGDLLGDERIERCISEALKRGQSGFDRIVEELDAFREQAPRSDDQCLIELACRAPQGAARIERVVTETSSSGAWALSLALQASALKHADPVAVLTQAVADLWRGTARQRLFLILTELYSNALEHGLLGLDSRVKHEADGYTRYYEARARALGALAAGTIRIDLEHTPAADGDELRLRLSHDGAGFDAPASTADPAPNSTTSGRGIALVRSLSQSLTYSNGGCTVDVNCRW